LIFSIFDLFSGIIATARNISSTYGFIGLWRGLGPTILRVFFGAGIYFSSIHLISDLLTQKQAKNKTTTTSSFLSGFLGRTVAAAAMSPVSIVKTRMEFVDKSSLPFKNTFSGILYIWKNEGIRNLYIGLIPTLIRDAPFSGIYYTFYNSFKGMMESELSQSIIPFSPVRNFLVGISAGAIATMITQPADVIRTRMQLSSTHEKSLNGFQLLVKTSKHLIQTEGFSGLFIGGVARITKRAVSTAITWTIFEEFLKISRIKS
jgi:solute carrier family 25, member 38